MYTPRSLATDTGEIVLPNRDKEIWGSLLISCAEPTTTNFVFSGFMSREFFAHHLLMSSRSWSRNTSLWRHNDVFRAEKPVIARHTRSNKNTILILYNFVLARVPIESFLSRLKYPWFWPYCLYMVICGYIWFSLISCNFMITPLYLIKMGFSL